jgi:hypothetical protein
MNHIILPGLIIPEIIIIIDNELQIIIPEFIIPEEIIYIEEISIKKSTIEMETYYDSDDDNILFNNNIDVGSLFIMDEYFSEKKVPSYLFKPTRNIVKNGYGIFLY